MLPQWILIVFYITGYVVAWYKLRKFFRKRYKDKYDWDDVVMVLVMATMSWAVVMVISNSNILNSKPPKFL